MFVYAPDYSYPWPIEVRRPSQTSPGTYEAAGTFVMRFRVLSDEAARRLDEEVAALPEDLPPEEKQRWRFYAVKAASMGWSGFSFDGTTEAAFSSENLAHALDDPHVAAAIARGWQQSLSEVLAGN